jgi:rhodanese-related sulfurtransferase
VRACARADPNVLKGCALAASRRCTKLHAASGAVCLEQTVICSAAIGLTRGPRGRYARANVESRVETRLMSQASLTTPFDRLAPSGLPSAEPVLDIARTRFEATHGNYAGAVTPNEAWRLFRLGAARLVDVRTAAELQYVGRVPGALHVEWRGKDPANVERFVAELGANVGTDEVVLFLCRSAVRSHHAAGVADEAGFAHAFNVLEGFEGQRNHAQQRGLIDGWRHHGLPWIQD